MRDEPDAGAMPAARPRRKVDQVEVTLAVESPSDWSATKIKFLRVLEISIRITAAGQRVDFFGNGLAWVGEDGRQRRFVARADGWLSFGAVRPGGDQAGAQLDIGARHLPRQNELDHHSNTGRGFASAVLPPPNISFAGAEPPCGGAMLDPERGERLTEFGGDRGARAALPETKHAVKFWGG